MKLDHMDDSLFYDWYTDDEGRYQGEYKEMHCDLTFGLQIHCFYKDNELHGEYKEWGENGVLIEHRLYIHGKKYHVPIHKISPANKLKLTLKHELRWLK